MRAVIYARYSSDLQSEASIQDQIELCRRYAEQHGWVVTSTYSDAAISGASRFRPAFQQLLNEDFSGTIERFLAKAPRRSLATSTKRKFPDHRDARGQIPRFGAKVVAARVC